MLPAPRPRDGRLVLGVRPRDLSRLHDVQPGRHPLPRPRRASHRARRASSRRRPELDQPAGDRDDDADRDQRRHLPAPARGRREINADSGWIFLHGALYGPAVADGDWYRLITAAFLHYGPIHLGMNMLALWWIGRPLEDYARADPYLLVYLVSGLAGSAGAAPDPTAVTVGASGRDLRDPGRRDRARAPADLRPRWRRNLIARRQPRLHLRRAQDLVGGHLGGLAGGALCILALSQFGKRNAVYSRVDAVSIVSIAAVGLLSIAVAYWKVRGYA